MITTKNETMSLLECVHKPLKHLSFYPTFFLAFFSSRVGRRGQNMRGNRKHFRPCVDKGSIYVTTTHSIFPTDQLTWLHESSHTHTYTNMHEHKGCTCIFTCSSDTCKLSMHCSRPYIRSYPALQKCWIRNYSMPVISRM